MKSIARVAGAGALLAGIVLSGPVPLAAQDPRETQTSSLEPIAVTGSRLRGMFGDEAWPLTSISRDELLATGEHRLGDILQQLPFTSGSPLNTQTSRRGEGGGLSRGIETIELRGLGPERTLVLLNGRRFVPGGNGASGLVDLGMLPLSMVERIEIFKSGASVEYGADALAGVINIITREAFDGVEASARGSITSRADAGTLSFGALFGRQFRRGGFSAGLDYTDQPSLAKDQRRFSRTRLTVDGPANEPVFDGSSAPPRGQFRTASGRLTLIEGRPGTSPADFRRFVDSGPDSDRFNFNPFEDLLQASGRLTLFGTGRWQASNRVTLRTELFYHDRDSSQQLAPLPLFTTRLDDVAVSADNAFNPFDETLTDVRRRLIEAGPRTFVQDNQAWRVIVGAEGNIGRWFWNTAFNHGRNETDQLKTGDLRADRVRAGLGPSFFDESGSATCGVPDAPIDDCVPLNLFGGPGSITPEMLDFIGTRVNDSGFNEQSVFGFNLAGDLFDIPAGAVAVAAGLEWREERAADRPDPESQAGNTTGNARGLTRGSFEATEAYLEIGVPLVVGHALARRVDLDIGGRLVDFDNFGTESVFEVGLGWQPLKTLNLRGSYSEAFRAPNVGELFGGRAQANPIVLDPCADFSGRTPVEIERCIAQGVPADGSFGQTGEETPELSGGNAALEPERGDILTLGLSWQPLGTTGPRLRLDYYDIEIDNGIAALGADSILRQCLGTGAARFCDSITRAPDGPIEFIEARPRNIARESARGIDLEADWQHHAGPGRMTHRALVSRVDERALVAFPGADPRFGAGGFDRDNFGAIPEWQGVYDLAWSNGRWSAGYQAQWIDSIAERGGEVFPGTIHRAGSVLYHDLRASWRASERWSFSAGVDNLNDVQPPLLVNADEANTDLATYRALGTTFWLHVGFRE